MKLKKRTIYSCCRCDGLVECGGECIEKDKKYNKLVDKINKLLKELDEIGRY